MKYRIINTARGGLCVAEYEASEPVPPFRIDAAYNGPEYVTLDESGNAVEVVSTRRVWTIAAFKRRLTQQERIAAREAAKSIPQVADYMDILDSSGEVQSDDPDIAPGLMALEALGVLAPGRANQILYGD